MFVSLSSKKLTWLLGLGLGLAGFSGFTASVLGQQSSATNNRAKSRPIVSDPKESQKTIQQYRQATAEAPIEEDSNPVKTADLKQPSRAAQPNYQRAPAAVRPEEPSMIQQAGHHGQSRGHNQSRSYIDDPTIVPMGDSCNGCTSCGNGDCDGGSCGDNCLKDCVPCNYFAQNGWYLGGDYLYSRVSYSEPTAILQREVTVDSLGNSTFHDQSVPYEFDYQSSYRINAGYRWGSCGEAINFSFFNFNNLSALNSIQANPPGLVVAGQLEQNPAPGQRLSTALDTAVSTYDLDYSKRIPICSCNSDPCSCCDCPPWAITWNAGARVGNVEINSPTNLYAVDGSLIAAGNSSVEFVGAGPKVGIEGRRYFGENYRWSAYGKSNVALLLGQYDVTLSKFTPAAQATSLQTYNYTRIVPMIDIEVGVSRQIGKRTLVTAGYFFQAWFDVSTINTIDFVGALNANPLDDANIMSFDGFMLRVEHTF
jgi:hypothetical protein